MFVQAEEYWFGEFGWVFLCCNSKLAVCFFEVVGFHLVSLYDKSYTVRVKRKYTFFQLQNFNNFNFNIRSGLWPVLCSILILFFFTHSVVTSQFRPNLRCWSDSLTFVFRILWRSLCWTMFDKPKSLPLHIHAWQLVWGVCVEVLWFVQIELCKPRTHCHVLWSPGEAFSWQPFQTILVQSFPNCTIMKFNI